MICTFCSKEIPVDAVFCCYCGKRLIKTEKAHSPKKRGNGQGTVFKKDGKYVAEKTIGYYVGADGKRKRQSIRKSFDKKKDAVAALATMELEERKPPKSLARFKDVYDLWVPTHTASKSTMDCYKSAWKYFEPLYDLYAYEVDIDDLQECMDDCPHGKRTHQNMKALIGLMYKYGIPRGYFPEKLNLAEYLRVSGDDGSGGCSLPDDYITRLKNNIGVVPGADLIVAQCYLGFRPSEFLSISQSSYDSEKKLFVGGAKTEAGKNRTVTIPKQIQSIVDRYEYRNPDQFFCHPNGTVMNAEAYRTLFYSVLDKLGLDNPMVDAGAGIMRHKYTPHSCRHTYSDFLKRATGSDKDKLALIGHTSTEMLRYYQDAPVDDLRKITDQFT